LPEGLADFVTPSRHVPAVVFQEHRSPRSSVSWSGTERRTGRRRGR
jgi:hypothetical protein